MESALTTTAENNQLATKTTDQLPILTDGDEQISLVQNERQQRQSIFGLSFRNKLRSVGPYLKHWFWVRTKKVGSFWSDLWHYGRLQPDHIHIDQVTLHLIRKDLKKSNDKVPTLSPYRKEHFILDVGKEFVQDWISKIRNHTTQQSTTATKTTSEYIPLWYESIETWLKNNVSRKKQRKIETFLTTQDLLGNKNDDKKEHEIDGTHCSFFLVVRFRSSVLNVNQKITCFHQDICIPNLYDFDNLEASSTKKGAHKKKSLNRKHDAGSSSSHQNRHTTRFLCQLYDDKGNPSDVSVDVNDLLQPFSSYHQQENFYPLLWSYCVSHLKLSPSETFLTKNNTVCF